VGVVSERDLGGRRGASLIRDRRVSEVMTSPAVTASPTTTLRRAANLMRGRSIGCLPVVEAGRLRGIVTVSDILEEVGRGSERPVQVGKRWTLRHRGTGRKRGAKGREERSPIH
jgi:signal-transduction protein with cAMP-binding, CBS, and nucleotidyltransferase domain